MAKRRQPAQIPPHMYRKGKMIEIIALACRSESGWAIHIRQKMKAKTMPDVIPILRLVPGGVDEAAPGFALRPWKMPIAVEVIMPTARRLIHAYAEYW